MITNFLQKKSNSYTFKLGLARKPFHDFCLSEVSQTAFLIYHFLYKFCSDFSLVLLVVWVFLSLPQAYLCYPDLNLFLSPFSPEAGFHRIVCWMAIHTRHRSTNVCVCTFACVCTESLNSHQGVWTSLISYVIPRGFQMWGTEVSKSSE